jgi:hypothetical protein
VILRKRLIAVGLLIAAPAFGTECLDLPKLLKSIPPKAPASIRVESARIITKHGLMNLIRRNPNAFVVRSLGAGNVLTKLGSKFRSGPQVSENFIKQVKLDALLTESRKADPGSYFKTSASTDQKYYSVNYFLAQVFRNLAVHLPYGYSSDNTSYPEHIGQYECQAFRAIGHSEPYYNILSGTSDSLVYHFEKSGEAFELKMEGSPEAGSLTLKRHKYVVAQETCSAESLYEAHPVEITYKLRWGAGTETAGAIEPVILNDDLQSLAAVDKAAFCAQPLKIEEDKSFETPMTLKMSMPEGHVTVSFEEGRITENTLLAKKWLTDYLGYDFVREKIAAIVTDGTEYFKIYFKSETDPAKLSLGLEVIETGTLNLHDQAKICREQGFYADFSVEFLRRHPELSCFYRQLEPRATDRDVDHLSADPTLLIKALRTTFHIRGIPLFMAEELRQGLTAYMMSTSKDPLFQRKDEEGKPRLYKVLGIMVNDPIHYKNK